MSSQEIILAYRSLYRATLQAIHFSKPARFYARDTLRHAFRHETATNFSPERVENTLRFLKAAAATNGIEHHVLKNILHVKYWEKNIFLPKTMIRNQDPLSVHVRTTKMATFYQTLGMLNESMGLCLR